MTPFRCGLTAVSCRRGRSKLSRLERIPEESLVLPSVPDCEHCGTKRFHMEPPSFCCRGGEVKIVCPPMPYSLKRLFTGSDEECEDFRRKARTYNNNVAFTSYAAKYDRELTKNKLGVYTFRVQAQNSDKLREDTLKLLMNLLQDNPYAKFFKSLRDVPNLEDHRIILNCNPGLDQRVYNLPTTSQVAAIWTETDDHSVDMRPHIQVYSHSSTSYRVQPYYGCCDSLQYPLLFPRGESGWHYGIKRFHKKGKNGTFSEVDPSVDLSSIHTPSQLLELEQRVADKASTEDYFVSAKEYYCYKFQVRDDDVSMLLHSLRLFQQFVVGSYIKIEMSRLDFHRRKQNEIRTEVLQGVLDSIAIGQTQGSRVGRRTILPASFIGGPRDMKRRYLDAMSLVQKYGKPDIFLTMTCNPMWKEIQEGLRYTEKPQDRPDLLSRVFRAKFEVLKSELLHKHIFGEVTACVYAIEFQKRGFPHAHVLLILKPEFKLLNAESYDKIVCAELPDPKEHQHLYSLVVKHMIHGPCGDMDKSCPCMKNGSCKSHYPKNFSDHTIHAEDSYPCYRRRNDGRKVKVRRHELDNRWVIPHNRYLLALIDCHINVEICSTVKLVKYLYKYVFIGPDLISFQVIDQASCSDVNEISNFQKGRWISPPEALWRIYEFRLSEMTLSVYTLQVHLPDQQSISFDRNSDLNYLLKKIDFSRTMLTEFFKTNKSNAKAQNLRCLYREFPEHFVWTPKTKTWSEREHRRVIGRLVTANPKEGERYFLRLLLCHVRGPTSFDDLLTVNGELMSSFREAALKMGLLESDNYIEETLEEAVAFQMPSFLRLLFATLLFYCSPTDPKLLWTRFEKDLSSDYVHAQKFTHYSDCEIKK
ncbi:uncharacterized protein LOC113755901 [Coffea eugenioides]|uniref:uncharacterized protein LOC113755901 n=1 Tax=Coffea eugenioides TaxID=49369 RepID=UPI000F60ACED|nr:uncharacterized protein LOC113755901 [Coffea eugenioides]